MLRMSGMASSHEALVTLAHEVLVAMDKEGEQTGPGLGSSQDGQPNASATARTAAEN